MAYGRKSIPPPSTPFEEFMATTSERMIAARLELVEFLRETPAAWFAIGVVVLLLSAASLNLRGKKKSAAGTAAAFARVLVFSRARRQVLVEQATHPLCVRVRVRMRGAHHSTKRERHVRE